MKEWTQQVALNVIAAIIASVFVYIFGLPNAKAVAVLAAVYALIVLVFGLFPLPALKPLLDTTLIRMYVMISCLLFPIIYLLLQSIGLVVDDVYAITLTVLYSCLCIALLAAKASRMDKSYGSYIGHASTIVCFEQDDDSLYTYLIYNKNHGLWLLPGGHLDIFHDEPCVVAKHRILSELGYDCEVLESKQVQPKAFQTVEILNGCHAFYRLSMGPRKCHGVHFDFAYVCKLLKRVAAAKYEFVRIKIRRDDSPGTIAGLIRPEIETYYRNKNAPIPSVTFPDDIPDRIYAGLGYYKMVE